MLLLRDLLDPKYGMFEYYEESRLLWFCSQVKDRCVLGILWTFWEYTVKIFSKFYFYKTILVSRNLQRSTMFTKFSVHIIIMIHGLKACRCSMQFHRLCLQSSVSCRYVTQGPKTRRLSFLAYLFIHILNCICFKMHFTEAKYLVSNWSYTCLIWTIKEVKNLNKKFKIFRLIIIIRNHYFIIVKLFWAIEDFILYQIKETIKIGLQLYNLWHIHGHQLNWRIVNSKTPFSFLGL